MVLLASAAGVGSEVDQDILSRLAKSFRAAEERLAKSDAGEGTQQVQRDIMKDLQELMRQAGAKDQQEQREGGRSAGSRQQPSRQMRANKSGAQGSQAGREQSRAEQALKSKGIGEGESQNNKRERIAELYKDVWGHLPATLRQGIEQYSQEQFMPKYEELLKQYYTTIAEKGRRKGE
jgi:hypothetical protein